MPSAYRIADEPAPGSLARLVVDPLWPLLGLMLGGAWLAWPWFLLNAYAVGSPSRRREAATVAIAVLGSLALLIAIAALQRQGALAGLALKLSVLSITMLKVGAAYALYLMQSRTFAVYRYYGGPVQSGLYVVLGALVLGRSRVLELLPGWLSFVLS